MDIGKSIRKNREFHGLSRQKLADILGINVSTLGRYETGKRTPSLSTLKNISNALSIDFDILVSWTDVLNSNPDVFDFLERVFYGFQFLDKLALLLDTNHNDKDFRNFFECNFSDNKLFLKIANILELTDTQLYNWILLLRIEYDFYHNKESYIKRYNPIDDIERLNSMITSNRADLDIQPFDELFYKGINDKNKIKIKNYFEKIRNSNNTDLSITEIYKKNSEAWKEYGKSWNDYAISIENNPKFLLHAILNYLETHESFYTALAIDLYNNEHNDDILEYLTDDQINSIIKKVTDLVEYEIYKIEKENQNNEKKE